MPEGGAITAKPAPSLRAKLRAALTNAAFAVGHIWAAVSVFVFAAVLALVWSTAPLDWPEGMVFDIIVVICFAVHAGFVIWLLYRGWRARRRGELTLRKAAWPLVTLSAVLTVATAIWLYFQYTNWQQHRHGTTGSILFRCQEIDENYNLHPSGLSFKHVRKETWNKSEWYIKMPEQPYRLMKPVTINTNFIHGSLSFQWVDERGVEMVAVMSSTTLEGMQDYGWKMETVDIGPAATVPLDWEVEGGRELAAAWVEQEFRCDADIESWHLD